MHKKTRKDCRFERYEHFANVSENERGTPIRHLNGLRGRNAQNTYSSALVSINTVQQRPRHDEPNANLNDFSFSFS